jgi:putative DNA primase/helicase
MEGTLVAFNDQPTFLDEHNQANPYETGKVVYMLANATGKQRANRAGGARCAVPGLQLCCASPHALLGA